MYSELKIVNNKTKLSKIIYIGDYSTDEIFEIIDFYTKHPSFSIFKIK